MIGIENIASYICENRESNFGRMFNGKTVDDKFIKKSIGIEEIAVKDKGEDVYEMCLKAYNNLLIKEPYFQLEKLDCIVLVTRHSNYIIPHTSAILHKKIFNLAIGGGNECATFDIHLGCSGYVYGVNIMKSFMESNGYSSGLLFTCDPLSDYIDKNDKNTAMLFGDAATVTYFKDNAELQIEKATYYTAGEYFEGITRREGEYIQMDGQSIFSFALQYVPKIASKNLSINNKAKEDVDLFVFHQPNRYMVESIAKRMKLDLNKVPIDIKNYGNTNSSSIPIILEKYIRNDENRVFQLTAVGDGFSIASVMLVR